MSQIVICPPIKGVCKSWALYLVQENSYSPILYLQKPLHVKQEFYDEFMRDISIVPRRNHAVDCGKIFKGENDE